MERESEEKYKGTVETKVEREGCKRSADFSIPTGAHEFPAKWSGVENRGVEKDIPF